MQVRGDAYFSLMRNYNGFYDSKSDTTSFTLSLSRRIHPVKPVKQPGQVLLWDGRTRSG